VHFTLRGQPVVVCVPPGSTHVQVGWAEQGKGPAVPVKVMVWPVQEVLAGQLVMVVMLVVVTTVPFPYVVVSMGDEEVDVELSRGQAATEVTRRVVRRASDEVSILRVFEVGSIGDTKANVG